jgi:hypothetical protein
LGAAFTLKGTNIMNFVPKTVLGAIIGMTAVTTGCADNRTPAEVKSDGNKQKACSYARDAVRKFLKYPLDSEFGWDSNVEEFAGDVGETFYTVTSTVSAKNGFGATHTLPWSATVLLSDNSFTLWSCTVDGKNVYTIPEREVAKIDAEIKTKEKAAADLKHKREDEEKQALAAEAERQRKNAEEIYRKSPEGIAAAVAAEKKAEFDREAERNRRREALEANAQDDLKQVKKYLEKHTEYGDKMAKRRLEDLVKEYPETKAAEEGRKLLAEIGK